jgi:hypothetical protein
MRTLTNPQLWAHPGHGQTEGVVALVVLLFLSGSALASATAHRFRVAFAPVSSDRHRSAGR